MFEIIYIEELLKRLDRYNHQELHVHHTYEPSHSDFNGNNGIELQNAMKNYHVKVNGWSDIGQHVTLLPNGLFVTGRDFGRTPASISGQNSGAFACETLGNFDIGHDVLQGEQKDSLLRLAKYFDEKKKYVRFHRENSNKTCPGSSIDKDTFMNEVRSFGVAPAPQPVIEAAPFNPKVFSFQVNANAMGLKDEHGNALVEDGKIGTNTRYVMNRPEAVVKRGMNNPLVGVIQTILGAKVDYRYGNAPFHQTYDAICKFQLDNGLKVDGVVGPKTWVKLLE